MGCCGSPGQTVKYKLTDPSGVVHVYLSEPEVRIALAKYGGGMYEVIRENKQ